MNQREYWKECISLAAEGCQLSLTEAQLEMVAESVEGGHENYGMAFYTPPSSERLQDIDREWKSKYDRLKEDFDRYRGNAEIAVKDALHQHHDANVSIGEHGDVFRHDGRTTQIQ